MRRERCQGRISTRIRFSCRTCQQKKNCIKIKKNRHHTQNLPTTTIIIMIHLPLQHPYFHVFSSFSFSSESPLQALHHPRYQPSVYGADVSLQQSVQQFPQAQQKLLHARLVSFLLIQLAEGELVNAVEKITMHTLCFLLSISLASLSEAFRKYSPDSNCKSTYKHQRWKKKLERQLRKISKKREASDLAW
jgi:hypothetical protein